MENRRYQAILIGLLALTWGFVFLDRVVITYLFPILTQEFGFNNAQVGLINMVTSLGYIGFSIFFCIFADRSGFRKKWLVPLVLLAAVFSGASAFAVTFMAFVLLRLLVGVSEGPVFPLISSIVNVETNPEKFALSIGIISLVSTCLTTVAGPIAVTQIAVNMGWQSAFILTSIPTLVLGLIIWLMVKEVDRAKVLEKASGEKVNLGDFTKILKYRNIVMCMILVSLIMISLWSVAIYMPLYLTQVAGLSTETMGFMMAAYGAAGLLWALIIPAVSNRIGRKPAVIIFSLVAAIPFFALYLSHGTAALALFVGLAGILTFMPLLFFGIISTETVPPFFAATASALIMGVGELFGAAIAPRILGGIADGFGLPVVYLLGAFSLILASAIGFGLLETHPRLASKQAAPDSPVKLGA